MPRAADPRRALVSLWEQGTPGAPHTFIGSGMFINPLYVFTARHVTCDNANHPIPVWLGHVEGQHELRPVKEIHCFPEAPDIALVELDVPNQYQDWCPLDLRTQDLQGQEITLYGVYRETKSTIMTPCTVTSYEAAERCYLTNYAQPKGLSGGAAIRQQQIVGVISARYRDDSLGCIVPISLAQQWLAEKFPALRDFLGVAWVGAVPPESSRAHEIHEALSGAVRKEVQSLLHKSSLKVLRDTIAQQVGNQQVEEVLIPSQALRLREALRYFYQATKRCLEELTEENTARFDQVRQAARKIFGWLVVLAVDHDKAQAAGLAFDPQQDHIELRTPLATEAAIEVFVSASSTRAARFRRSGSRLTGEDGFSFDGLEMGIGQADQLTEMLKRIWVEVFREDAPHPFGETQRVQLQSTLRVQRDFEAKCYYVTVPSNHGPGASMGPGLLRALTEALPALPVIYLHSEQSPGVLVLDEPDLEAIILQFLRMLEGTV